MCDRLRLTTVVIFVTVTLPCVVGCSDNPASPHADANLEASGSADSTDEAGVNLPSSDSSSVLSFKTRGDVPDQSWRKPPEPRRYPSFPDAIGSVPPWLVDDKSVPFDIAEYAATPDWEDNAAPLYLDALYEFSLEPQKCFSEDEQTRRSPLAKARTERFYKIYNPWAKNHRSVNAAAFVPILKEYETGFQKLSSAQQKQQCVFQTGTGLAALLPHVQSARNIARVASVRAWSELQTGNIDAAIQDSEITFRVGRDIAHRGVLISALVSTAIEQMACDYILRDVLLNPKLTTEQCDRLISILAEQEKTRDMVWRRAWQGEYVGFRVALHDLQYRAGDFSPAAIKTFDLIEAEVQGQTLGQFAAGLMSDLAYYDVLPGLADHLDSMTDVDFQREVVMANASFKSLLDLFDRPLFERHKLASLIGEQLTAKGASKILPVFIGEVPQMDENARRGSTRLAAFKSLVCIRRWQLEHSGAAPPDLATALKAAGIAEPVVDGYGKGEPLRFTTIGGEPVVYSVGPDGKDDKGLKEWAYDPKQLGDWTFRIESGEADESRREAARNAVLTASEIMTLIKRRYREASSYQDDGVQTESHASGDSERAEVVSSFRTRFDRQTDKFVFTFNLPDRSYTVLRQSLNAIQTFDSLDDEPEQNESLLSALHIANGVSNATALLIPCILIPAEVNRSSFWGGKLIQGLRRVDDEEIDGVSYLRLHAKYFGSGHVDFWITHDFTIQRIVTNEPALNDLVRKWDFNAQLDEELPFDTFKFDAP